ncbi:hypothetical protein BH11PLA1_BH11PLA1_14940 [soil metagenome]
MPPTPAPSVTGVFHPAHARAEIDAVEHAVLEAVAKFDYPEASKFALRVALEEAMVNAFLHGHRGLPPDVRIDVHYTVSPDTITIAVTDHGVGFTPHEVPDPTSDENLELPSGRGLMLIQAYMSDVRHELNGRRIVMVYTRP